MLDHTRITVADFEKTKAWYTRVLATIGYKVLTEVPGAVTGQADVAGFGDPADGEPSFWLVAESPDNPAQAAVNVGFRASSRAMVDAFREAALIEGASDEERRRSQPSEGANSFSARVHDPHGNTLSATYYEDSAREAPAQPQSAPVADLASHANMPMPRNISLFEQLTYGGLGIGTVSFILDTEYQIEADVSLEDWLFGVVITVFLVFMAARKKQNWARITYLVLMIFGWLLVMVDEVSHVIRPDPFLTLINSVSGLMTLVALVLVFTDDSDDWFRKKPNS